MKNAHVTVATSKCAINQVSGSCHAEHSRTLRYIFKEPVVSMYRSVFIYWKDVFPCISPYAWMDFNLLVNINVPCVLMSPACRMSYLSEANKKVWHILTGRMLSSRPGVCEIIIGPYSGSGRLAPLVVWLKVNSLLSLMLYLWKQTKQRWSDLVKS